MTILLTLIVMLSSCNDTVGKIKIEGKWVMCSYQYNNTVTKYNVCPKLEFTKDNQGKIIFVGEESNFTYILLSDSTIELSFIGDSNPFHEKKYFYKTFEDIIEGTKYENLEIFSGNKKSRYFLSRTKKQ